MDFGKGVALATVLGGMLAATGCGGDGSGDVGEQEARIKCEGGNSCSGTSECASADGASACQGMNDCKGQGWIYTDTEEECEALQQENMS